MIVHEYFPNRRVIFWFYIVRDVERVTTFVVIEVRDCRAMSRSATERARECGRSRVRTIVFKEVDYVFVALAAFEECNQHRI